MDMRKFREKSVTALQDAQSVAKEYGNQEIGIVPTEFNGIPDVQLVLLEKHL